MSTMYKISNTLLSVTGGVILISPSGMDSSFVGHRIWDLLCPDSLNNNATDCGIWKKKPFISLYQVIRGVRVMVFNTTFNNISVISWHQVIRI
jgi:hypothetical protein